MLTTVNTSGAQGLLALFEQFLGEQAAQRFGVDAQEACLLNQLRKSYMDKAASSGETGRNIIKDTVRPV